jgi:hypothetical protein
MDGARFALELCLKNGPEQPTMAVYPLSLKEKSLAVTEIKKVFTISSPALGLLRQYSQTQSPRPSIPGFHKDDSFCPHFLFA